MSQLATTPAAAGAAAAEDFAARYEHVRRATEALCEAEQVNEHALAYLNRLSDHLFVAARHLAAAEGGDVLWQPGATRDS